MMYYNLMNGELIKKNENRYEKGKKGEIAASKFLIEQGFEIINKNFRYGKHGEIDIIAKKNDLVIFVEVKTRFNLSSYGNPSYAINKSKVKNIKTVATYFINLNGLSHKNYTYRFDLINIVKGNIEWIKDIIR